MKTGVNSQSSVGANQIQHFSALVERHIEIYDEPVVVCVHGKIFASNIRGEDASEVKVGWPLRAPSIVSPRSRRLCPLRR
ncbi:hypothetical protein EVAR_66136_1 [Eumeta japonica]|uniref:Uncharacterized protein n=1 Tax=Eumeta variegata TaxID=151549 RepID=A0A4C1Z1W6_EUMVA|nr:hypothetical protein EVAR_66136_1 [Eumeta japonica]